MAGPARNGALIYANNIKTLSTFYIAFFNMRVLRETPDFISLDTEDFNVIIHKPPSHIVDAERFNTVKLFLAVDSIEQAKINIVKYGGKALDGVWHNPLFSVCNVIDPDGNHLQLREFA